MRNRCTLEASGGTVILTDGGGGSGTLVNNKKISRAELRSGDLIQIGDTRYYIDRERELLKAKIRFEKALKIKPTSACAKLWMARMQTTTANDKVRDLKGGIRALESVWESTGRRSWRLAYFLYEAYYRAGQSADADRMWAKTLELAPGDKHEQLQADRRELWDKVKPSSGEK